jgi:hypothetical protein
MKEYVVIEKEKIEDVIRFNPALAVWMEESMVDSFVIEKKEWFAIPALHLIASLIMSMNEVNHDLRKLYKEDLLELADGISSVAYEWTHNAED